MSMHEYVYILHEESHDVVHVDLLANCDSQ